MVFKSILGTHPVLILILYILLIASVFCPPHQDDIACHSFRSYSNIFHNITYKPFLGWNITLYWPFVWDSFSRPLLLYILVIVPLHFQDTLHLFFSSTVSLLLGWFADMALTSLLCSSSIVSVWCCSASVPLYIGHNFIIVLIIHHSDMLQIFSITRLIINLSSYAPLNFVHHTDLLPRCSILMFIIFHYMVYQMMWRYLLDSVLM